MSAITDLRAQQQALRARCIHPSQTFVTFPREAIEQSIPDCFEQQVRRYPERLAVKTRSHSLTYAALNTAANRAAHALLELRGEAPEPVGLLIANGAPFVVASLGAAKAGKIQVPLDLSFPPARLTAMREQSQASVIVTDNRNLALAQELAGASLPVINVEALPDALPTTNAGLRLSAERWATILYTSGSTGEPKGLARTHRRELHTVMQLTNAMRLCAEDRLALPRAVTRAAFYALLNGAALYPYDYRQEEMADLAEWLIQEEVTIHRSAVSTFRNFVAALKREVVFPHLRLVSLFGEPVYHTDVELFRQHLSERCLLVPTLGCSEMGDYASFWVDQVTPLPRGSLPGGYPEEGMEVLILDEDGRPVGGDEIGEIAVRGHCDGLGYWRRPDLMQAALLPGAADGEGCTFRTGDMGRRLPDGCLLHLGRKDFQVKIRGYRVEVAEVETALLDLDTIKQAVVVARQDHSGDPRLVAYLVPSGPHVPTVRELRDALAAKLPEYMIPSAFVALAALPLTGSGKIDRRALPAPGRARPELDNPFAAPRTPIEEALAVIWAEILGLDAVGIDDSFLELGGDSLRATRILTRVRDTFQIELPLQRLFETPTVAGLAVAILRSRAEDGELAALLAELEGVSDAEAQLHFTDASR